MDISINLSVQDLVIDALDFIRVVNQFTNASGYDIERGCKLLNEIIAEMNATGSQIPFYYSFQFDLIAGQSIYYIGTGSLANVSRNYLNNITYINVYYSDIKYPVYIIDDYDALSSAIETGIQFLPSYARWYLENDSTGNTYTVINFLYPPDQTYVCEIRGKPSLDSISIISSTIYNLPLYYRSYLRYELGKRLIPYYGRDDVWTPFVQQQYEDARNIVKSSIEIDLRVRSGSALMKYPYNYSFNLGVLPS